MEKKQFLKVMVAQTLILSPVAMGNPAIVKAKPKATSNQTSSTSVCIESNRELYGLGLLEAALQGMTDLLGDPCSELQIQSIGYVFRTEPSEDNHE